MKKPGVMLWICSLCLGSVIAIGGIQDSNLKDTTKSKYKVGQEWSYKTRPNEEASSFIVVKIENNPKLGNIVHIALHNLKMKNPHSPTGISDTVNHLPFSEDAINKSAIKVLKEKVDLPDYQEGYQQWRKAFEGGTGGIYAVTIAEVVNVMEAGLNPH